MLTVQTQMTFGQVLHPWSNPCISSHVGNRANLLVNIFPLTTKRFGFFLLSLSPLLLQHLPVWFLFFVVTWRHSTLCPIALMCFLQDTHFCVRGLGFYGLISGHVNCSDQRWWLARGEAAQGMVFLTHWVNPWGWNSGASFLRVQDDAEELWPWGQYPVHAAQSHSSSLYFRQATTLFHFVVLAQGTVTWSLCCRAGVWCPLSSSPLRIFMGRQQGIIAFPCPANGAGHHPLSLHVTQVCAPCTCLVLCAWTIILGRVSNITTFSSSRS